MADQSSHGGGCLAEVGRAQAQQSLQPWATPFCFSFLLFLSHSTLGAGEESGSRGGQGGEEETWVPDPDLGQLPPAALCLPAGQRGSRIWSRPFLTFGEWKADAPLPSSQNAVGTLTGAAVPRLAHKIPGSSCCLLFLWLSYWKI